MDSPTEGGRGFDYRCGLWEDLAACRGLAFLATHEGDIAFATIDIGANDLFVGGSVRKPAGLDV
jgi:hypothetical protein